MIHPTENKDYQARFKESNDTVKLLRRMQEQFDKLNFTPFVNTRKKEEMIGRIK